MKFDIWFYPNTELSPNDRPSAVARGVASEFVNETIAEKQSLLEDPAAGQFRIQAAQTWAGDGLEWWAGSNEERFSVGPCPTKEGALLEALDNGWEQVFLVETKLKEVDLSGMAENLLERIDLDNEDVGDPDGDGLFKDVNDDQIKALDVILETAVRTWMAEHGVKPASWAFEYPLANEDSFTVNLEEYLKRAITFSFETFGPGPRTNGVIDHITKELVEVQTDPREWVDVAILALDGAWRAMLPTSVDTAVVDAMVKHLCGLADYILARPLNTFDEAWALLRQMPSDPALWVNLHICSMQQDRSLHVWHAADGATLELAYGALFHKLTRNQLRIWPDWRKASPDKAIEHDRTGERHG